MLSPGPQRSFSTVCGGTVMFMSVSPQSSARTQRKAKSHHSKRSLLPGLRCSGAASRAVTGRTRTVVDMHTPAALVPAKLRLFLPSRTTRRSSLGRNPSAKLLRDRPRPPTHGCTPQAGGPAPCLRTGRKAPNSSRFDGRIIALHTPKTDKENGLQPSNATARTEHLGH